MRIAFITQPWDIATPGTGGHSSIPILSYRMALKLRARGHVVSIFARVGDGQPVQEREETGIEFIRIPLKKEDMLAKPLKFYDRLARGHNPKRPAFASERYYRGYAAQIATAMQSHPPDVVHIHNFSQFVPLFRARFPRAKIVLHMHCEWLNQLSPTLLERRLAQTDLILGCSDFITGEAQTCFPQFSARCATVFNGVDVLPLATGTPSDPREILYVGRISPEKGIHVLLAAFERVAAELPDAKLTLAGAPNSAPYEFLVALSDNPHVRALARFYGGNWLKSDLSGYMAILRAQIPPPLAARISFLGFVPHANLPELYRRAAVLVNPSLSEAFGMSLIEALVVGTPVVATRVGGMPNIISDGETGVLVSPDNPTALANGIIRLLKDDSLRMQMGVRGRTLVAEQFSWDAVTDSLLAAYRTIVGDV